MKTNDRLETLILDRLEKLEKKFEWIINAKVYLREEKFQDTMRDKLCQIELSVPGPDIFTRTYEESYEAAIAEAFSDMEMQLRKHKGKMYHSNR